MTWEFAKQQLKLEMWGRTLEIKLELKELLPLPSACGEVQIVANQLISGEPTVTPCFFLQFFYIYPSLQSLSFLSLNRLSKSLKVAQFFRPTSRLLSNMGMHTEFEHLDLHLSSAKNRSSRSAILVLRSEGTETWVMNCLSSCSRPQLPPKW